MNDEAARQGRPATINTAASEGSSDRGRLWAAFMLARTLAVAESILAGRPVMVRRLDQEALRHALRGMPAPPPSSYVRIRHGHLDAIAECGPLTIPEKEGR